MSKNSPDKLSIGPAVHTGEVFAGRAVIGIVLCFAAVYVALALTPSHYAVGLRALGITAHPLLGTAKEIRSDEWAVLTPLFKIAVLGRFSPTDMISPYHESLKGFLALPIQDWSIFFKPQLWGFWLMPPAYAYSFYFASLWLSFLIGYTLLLRQLGASLWIAALGSLALYSSHFVQVWWTSNAPTLALAPWPAVAFLLRLRPSFKALLLVFTSCIWVFGEVYPPFIISAAFAEVTLMLAFRRDAFKATEIAAGLASLGAFVLLFFAYFGDLITVMQQTEYPGHRISSGGGVEESKILAHLFPFFTTTQFDPLLSGSNQCEIAVVSTLLPLTMLVFAQYRSIIGYVRQNWLACLILGVGLGMMLAWMLLPVPETWGLPFLWQRVPPVRMVWGFGLLLTLALAIIASEIQFSLSGHRFVLFFVIIICSLLVSKYIFILSWADGLTTVIRSWFYFVPIIPFSISAFFAYRLASLISSAELLFAAAAISGMVTFGTFNPLQSAHAIFANQSSSLLDKARQQVHANPNGWAAIPGGFFGALLNGSGIPAINHTLMAPQLDFFRRIFPDLSPEQIEYTFNRYGHIIIQEGALVHVNTFYADQIIVPLEPFLKPVPNIPSPGR